MSEYIYETNGGASRRIEEITRCHACKHMYETMDGFECERMSGQYHACEPDGFCAWAERRES